METWEFSLLFASSLKATVRSDFFLKGTTFNRQFLRFFLFRLIVVINIISLGPYSYTGY